MASLVFDIETSALPTGSFDETTLEYLFRPAERESDPDQKQARREEIERQFALWPFTAEIVCIAMLIADTQKGQVLFVADDFEEGLEKNPDVATATWQISSPFTMPADEMEPLENSI